LVARSPCTRTFYLHAGASPKRSTKKVALNLYDATIKVDVAPLQREQVAEPHAVIDTNTVTNLGT